jgi:hypothetical protein
MSSPSAQPRRDRHAFAFDAPPGIAIVAVVVVALLVIGFMLWPVLNPGPSETAPATASASPTPQPSVTLAPSPTPEPTATAEATPTPIAEWTGLDWSEPVTPSFTVHLYDLVPWGDGQVAVGELPGQGWASLTSPDGLTWTVQQRDFPGAPRHLVALDDELFAFMPEVRPNPPGTIVGAPPTSIIWRSTDGVTWTVVDSASWLDAWHDVIAVHDYPDGWSPAQHDPAIGLVDVASGPRGLVAIGNSFGTDAMAPIILHSGDGATWAPAELPNGSDSALLNSVVDHGGRFVVTGATGAWTEPAAATMAAWYSDDGLTWTQSTIEADEFGLADGAELGPLWAADDGLLACRGNRGMTAGGWRYMDAWLSTDGTSWRYSPQPGPHPACDWSASDGTRIVTLGPRDHASPMPGPGVTVASASTDGVTWQSLELGSTLTDRLERFWVVPDGVLYAGEQSFWFGTAIEG